MKWTLVTGSSKGIGREIAIELAKSGKNLALHYFQSETQVNELRSLIQNLGVNAEIIRGDFSTSSGVDNFLEEYNQKFSETENLINNVGNYLIRSLEDTSLDEWQTLFQTNFFAPIAITKALFSSIKSNQGSIINLGVSGLNSLKAESSTPAYTFSKLCLLAYTKALAKEGIRANMISPGYIENSIDWPKDIQKIPLKRVGTLSEVAVLVKFLLSNEAKYIIGQNIEVAGGVNL